ncbi:MAG: transcription initiation protein [Nocardioides sp.]|nr:transcription initiation protein [Nocardioides sp.]
MSTTYVVLLPGDENRWEALSAEEQAAVFAKHEAFTEALTQRGHTVTGGAELTHSRETTQLRSVGGETVVTQGPYAETVEQLSGFYVVESTDLDDLVDCTRILLDEDGAIEIRATTDAGQG